MAKDTNWKWMLLLLFILYDQQQQQQKKVHQNNCLNNEIKWNEFFYLSIFILSFCFLVSFHFPFYIYPVLFYLVKPATTTEKIEINSFQTMKKRHRQTIREMKITINYSGLFQQTNVHWKNKNEMKAMITNFFTKQKQKNP